MHHPCSRLNKPFTLVLWLLTVLLTTLVIGCDSDSPTNPADGPLLPDFNCEEASNCSLTCTDRTTGGQRPYLLLWQADEQAPSSVINPTFSWNFDNLELVRIRLIVTDDAGEGETAGPVERAFEICGGSNNSTVTTTNVATSSMSTSNIAPADLSDDTNDEP